MVDTLLSLAQKEMEKRGFEGDAILVGSVAKGTYLRDPDIDIFLRFPKEIKKDMLKRLGLEIGKAIIPDGFAKYAEHPYWHGTYEGFEVDIVPCYRITSPDEKMSAVDRTPFHTEYVKRNLKEWQKDEVRLLKTFLKGIGAYGAEAKVQGFSGYMTELLILKYGDFISTLKNVANWRKKVYLHLEDEGENFRDPVVFIDPVDPHRNAASAVSEEKKSLFIYASQRYLEEPSIKFFFPEKIKPLNREKILKLVEERGTYFYVISFPRPDMVEDNLYPQMRRTLEIFVDILRDFHPVNSLYQVTSSHVHFIIELERDLLPNVKKHCGPPVWHENSKNFLSRWRGKALRGPYIVRYRWFADILRNERSVKEVLEKRISNYKLGKYFENNKGKMVIDKMENVIDELNMESLTEFLMFKFPWER